MQRFSVLTPEVDVTKTLILTICFLYANAAIDRPVFIARPPWYLNCMAV
jgi:hypothetical protein